MALPWASSEGWLRWKPLQTSLCKAFSWPPPLAFNQVSFLFMLSWSSASTEVCLRKKEWWNIWFRDRCVVGWRCAFRGQTMLPGTQGVWEAPTTNCVCADMIFFYLSPVCVPVSQWVRWVLEMAQRQGKAVQARPSWLCGFLLSFIKKNNNKKIILITLVSRIAWGKLNPLSVMWDSRLALITSSRRLKRKFLNAPSSKLIVLILWPAGRSWW